jgi:hypothetical protein
MEELQEWWPQEDAVLTGRYGLEGPQFTPKEQMTVVIETDDGSRWRLRPEAEKRVRALDLDQGQIVTIKFNGMDPGGIELYSVGAVP